MMNAKEKQLIQALEDFKNSALNLYEVWEQQDYEVSDLLIEKYPFQEDFLEMVHAIMEWREHAIESLEKRKK